MRLDHNADAEVLVRGPSDEQQFETMDAGHLLYLILESNQNNMLFRSPIPHPKVRRFTNFSLYARLTHRSMSSI